jgi:hypothetical protein
MVNKVTLEQTTFRVLQFYPDSPIHHDHLRLHASLIRRASGQSVGTFQQSDVFPRKSFLTLQKITHKHGFN